MCSLFCELLLRGSAGVTLREYELMLRRRLGWRWWGGRESQASG